MPTDEIIKEERVAMDGAEPFVARFPYMESELYTLISYYDEPRLSIYGFIDAIQILIFRSIDFAFFREDSCVFSSVWDPTLTSTFSRITASTPDNAKINIHGVLYIALYEPSFSGLPSFAIINENTHDPYCPHRILKRFISWLKERSGMREVVSEYFKKLELQEFPSPIDLTATSVATEIFNAHPDRDLLLKYKRYQQYLVDYLYSHALHSPILMSLDDEWRANVPNLFFVISEPTTKRTFFDGTREIGYRYTGKTILAAKQKRDIISCLSDCRVTEADLSHWELPLANERSVLDRAISAGILSIVNALEHGDEYCLGNGRNECIEKDARNAATSKIFKAFFGMQGSQSHANLLMNQFVIHIGGVAYLTCFCLTRKPDWSNHHDVHKHWMRNFYFYTVMKTKISGKAKRFMKDVYLGCVEDMILAASQNGAAHIDVDYVTRHMRAISEVFPFNVISFSRLASAHESQIIRIDAHPNYSSSLDKNEISLQCLLGDGSTVKSVRNRKFHNRHIPFRTFSYNNEIREMLGVPSA